MATATTLGLSLSLSPLGLTTLRILPWLGTTASLAHAWVEYISTSSFLARCAPTSTRFAKAATQREAPTQTCNDNEVSAALDIAIPHWFTCWFNSGVYSVVALNCISFYSGLANVLLFKGLGKERKWYLAGTLLAVSHMAFVPLVAGPVSRIMQLCVKQQGGEETGKRGAARSEVQKWVRFHCIRAATVDVAAWGCFAVGVVRVLTK